jgi:endopeptidase La
MPTKNDNSESDEDYIDVVNSSESESGNSTESEDEQHQNIKPTISKKRKRNDEEQSSNDSQLTREMMILYNLYDFLYTYSTKPRISVVEYKKFIQSYMDNLTTLSKDTKSRNKDIDTVIKSIGYNIRVDKRAFKKVYEELIGVCFNGCKDLMKEINSKSLNMFGIKRILNKKLTNIEDILYKSKNNVDYQKHTSKKTYKDDEEGELVGYIDKTQSDSENLYESDNENSSSEGEEPKIPEEDAEFLNYLKSKGSTATNDFKYFKSLKTTTKTELLDMLQTIKFKNSCHKPYLFRALESDMPIEVKAEVVRKVEMASNDDNNKLIAWIEALLKVPFGKLKKPDVKHSSSKKHIQTHFKDALKTMDKAIYGHSRAKNAILQIIAQNFSNPKGQSVVLGIQGPMGNGKTTLVEKGVAKVLNRPFIHISLGGAKDSSFLEGHDYTYIGSKWGKIADVLMKAGCMNPIFYFDELDKVSHTEKGDEIINVLMHLIDTSQNSKFEDKYFTGVDIDLSNATFIFSYNDSSLVSPILMDRITEIKTSGFKTEEKIKIANEYLQPSMLSDVGFKKCEIKYDDDVYKYIIEKYTVEGGVRKLKEILYQVGRELNLRRLMSGKVDNSKIKFPLKITKDILDNDILKKYSKITHTKIPDFSSVGKINGMYATTNHTGGITIIEVKSIPTKQKLSLELTGSQGKVMRESMSVAKTVAWNLLPQTYRDELNKEWNNGFTGFHIHCPDGSTEKDGPSAGLAITTAIVSSMTGINIKKDIAVTGEIDLDGSAMAIGGLVHKLYGAKKAGVKLAMCPVENEEDILRIQKEYSDLIDDDFKVVMINNIWDVLDHALEENNIEFESNECKKMDCSRIKRQMRMKRYDQI